MMDVCIYVANHRDTETLPEEPYRLLRVGSDVSDAYTKDGESIDFDSIGDNISFKNFAYCELTGLYWIWKNTDHDVTGLVHYRRHLASPLTGTALSAKEVEQALEVYECLVPKPIPLSCSVEEHYCAGHIAFDLAALMDVMGQQPERYQRAFSDIMASHEIIPCNIMIARKSTIDAYCSWLFPVLEECEKRINLYSGRDEYQRRVFGFLAERLMMVWLKANSIKCGFYDLIIKGDASNFEDVVTDNYVLDLSSGIHGLSREQLFDDDFYLDLYDDVAQFCPPGTPLGHYIADGIGEGRMPSPAYALKDYANLRPELRSEFGEIDSRLFEALSTEVEDGEVILAKNVTRGVTKIGNIDYAPVYDWAYYTSKYDDVPDDYFHTEKALKHFVEVGIPEGRQGSKGFSLAVFKEKHPVLARLFKGRNHLCYLWYILGRGRKSTPVDWEYSA